MVILYNEKLNTEVHMHYQKHSLFNSKALFRMNTSFLITQYCTVLLYILYTVSFFSYKYVSIQQLGGGVVNYITCEEVDQSFTQTS